MTTLLSREQVDALRSIGDGALVLWALVMIDANYRGRATRAHEIAMLVKKDVRTVEKQLNELCAGNRAVNTAAGYVLLEGGRALLLGMAPMNVEALAQSPEVIRAQVMEDQALTPQPHPAFGHPPYLITNGEGNVEELAHNACALKKEEEDSINSIKNIDSSSSESSAQNAQANRFQALTVDNILEASDVLFEKKVVMAGLRLELINVNYALACLAHAYAQSAHLRNPVGLAYNMLKMVNRPRREYIHAPMVYLPNEFKELFGLALYTCTWSRDCGAGFAKAADLEAHLREVHEASFDCAEPGTVRSAQDDVHESTDAKVVELWGKVLYVLRGELAKASFETWVQGTFVVSLDDDLLTVAAKNAYARDWLESRLTATVNRIAGVDVAFVVGGEG